MKPILIANWKMNLNLREAFINAQYLNQHRHTFKFILAPPTPYLAYFVKKLPKIIFCAQDVSTMNGYGPYTGETSADILKSCGINYAIIGHSEQRSAVGYNNTSIQKKVSNCLSAGIKPIICVGEPLVTRRNNQHKEFLLTQITNSIISTGCKNIIIAYEPIWAIGTGVCAKPNELQEIFHFIKTNTAISQLANDIQLVYGGSVDANNYKKILSIKEVAGILVGNASLKSSELKSILN